MGQSSKWLLGLFWIICLQPSAISAGMTEFSAIISDDIGCSMTLPSVLRFTPQRTADFIGAPKTHEIKTLRAVFTCKDKSGRLTPKITLQGNTPYNTDTVFLDGTPNSSGFMVRLFEGMTPSLNDFYNTEKAISRGKQITLTPLNAENHYRTEEIFLVGMVGPMEGPATPGEFSAALIFNLIFQ